MTATDDSRSGARSFSARGALVLWAAFVLVHAWLCFVNLYNNDYPLGDVTLVYKFWMGQAFDTGHIVGITDSWVYPIVALVPMLLARLFGPDNYAVSWLGIVILLDAIAFGFLIGWGRHRRNAMVAWWWLGFLLLLGPIAVARIDSISVPLAIVGVLFVASRPRAASVILTIAAWIKVWPGAIVAAMVVATKARWRILLAALATSLAIIVVALGFGSGLNVFSFVTQQTGRGLQVEAPVSTVWLWQALWGVPGASVYYDQGILTFQVAGDGVAAVGAVMTPLLALVALAIVLLALLALRNRAPVTEILPVLALALVTCLIAVNKVGSPQYISWLAVPVILGLATVAAGHGRSFRVPAVIVAVIAALTQSIYPYLYTELLALNPVMLVLLTVRNLLLFVLLGWAVAVLWRLGRRRDALEEIDESAWLPAVWPFPADRIGSETAGSYDRLKGDGHTTEG